MNLFDVAGIILIAVDDKFTLEDKDGIEVAKGSIHRQFLDNYYTNDSGHKEGIAKIVAERGDATEIVITIGDKTFVLFAYSTQGKREDYANETDYRRGFCEIDGSLKKVFDFCKKNFPNEVVHTVPIGTGVQPDRTKKPFSISESENRLNSLAYEVGINIKIMRKS